MNVARVEVKKNTDQLNYEDFLSGLTRIVKITGVENGRKEAQYDISIDGDDRYWRPPATVLKLLVLAYSDSASNWVGKYAALYGDPEIKMKGKKVGGIRVSHLSHIDEPLSASLMVTRGQTETFVIQPLQNADIITALRAEWQNANPERRKAIEAEVAALQGTAPKRDDDPAHEPTERDTADVAVGGEVL